MLNKANSYRSMLPAFFCAILFMICAGCAASSTTVIDEEVVSNQKPMYYYTSLLIRDFELKRELYSDTADAGMSNRELRYSKLPAELSAHIEKFVTSRGSYKRVSRNGTPDASTLILSGRFIRLGRFKITIAVKLSDGITGQDVASFRETLWDVLDTTDSFADLGREVADFMYRIQYK